MLIFFRKSDARGVAARPKAHDPDPGREEWKRTLIGKASRMSIALPGNQYAGEPAAQIKRFAAQCEMFVQRMVANAKLHASALDTLQGLDAKTLKAKLSELKELEVFVQTEKMLDRVFDQFEGVRQINDFRSVHRGDAILAEGHRANQALRHRMQVAQLVLVSENSSANKRELQQSITHFQELCNGVLQEYRMLKSGLLQHMGLVSSITMQENGQSLNHLIVAGFIQEILAATAECANANRVLLRTALKSVGKLPRKQKRDVYKKYGNKKKIRADMQKHIDDIKPWVENWVEVQVISLVQREVFGNNKSDVIAKLNQSKDIMVSGFKELLESKIPEPILLLDEFFSAITRQSRLVSLFMDE